MTIDFSEGENEIIIKVSDKTNSFSMFDLENVLILHFQPSLNLTREYEFANVPILSGFSFGLPMARIYAKYFGRYNDWSFENKGTTVFIYINKLVIKQKPSYNLIQNNIFSVFESIIIYD